MWAITDELWRSESMCLWSGISWKAHQTVSGVGMLPEIRGEAASSVQDWWKRLSVRVRCAGARPGIWSLTRLPNQPWRDRFPATNRLSVHWAINMRISWHNYRPFEHWCLLCRYGDSGPMRFYSGQGYLHENQATNCHFTFVTIKAG